jgi:monoamine oxidase
MPAVSSVRPARLAPLPAISGDVFMCREDERLFEEDALASKRGVATPTRMALQEAISSEQLAAAAARASDASSPIGIIGGGVSGVFAALTLRSLGYHNVTIIESAPRVGGKAGSFEHGGKSFPIGAVSTPFALRESSFTGAQIFEKPIQFAASVVTHSARRLQILGARLTSPKYSQPPRF